MPGTEDEYYPYQGMEVTLNVYGKAPESAMGTLPKMVDRNFKVVRTALQNAGFTVVPVYDETATGTTAGNIARAYRVGTAGERDVAEGERLQLGTTIYLVVAGAKPVNTEGDKEPYLSSAYYSIMDVDHYEGGSARGIANAQLNTPAAPRTSSPTAWTSTGR